MESVLEAALSPTGAKKCAFGGALGELGVRHVSGEALTRNFCCRATTSIQAPFRCSHVGGAGPECRAARIIECLYRESGRSRLQFGEH
jgi:hypothetical protein